ncbi:cytochrome P450 716A1-like [Dioscorea cayenensis subsp. rotundata]|uniref:Cytochrome P450 716A1-like n=1 Tax=Dioscorea cayennensis subsp. rotundata TaxID=55577 RepID=A0AB40BRP8_DIOCR|nr:cytochrome P450 716A1-like [Dioscorea cayenensis subsp. rotundata]
MASELLALLLAFLLITIHLLTKTRNPSNRLPPGSLGIPIIGQSLGLLWAMRTNTGEQWINNKIKKFGPISKLTLFGNPTVFLTGPVANKFIFSSTDSLALQQPQSMCRIIGRRNILELIGKDHKRVRGAISYFLKPEALRKYVFKIDQEIRHHLRTNWSDHNQVKILPSMKSLTFNVICSTIFGIERGAREILVQDFAKMMTGMWSVPVNLPFTNFNQSLKASSRIRKELTKVIEEKRRALKLGERSSDEDLITYLLSLGSDNGETLTEEEILDNAVLLMVAGHDTTAIVLTFLVRHLANDPITYAKILNEHEEIAKIKAPEEALTWDDLLKMKFTWRVAQEIMRTIPPVFGGFRRVIKDVEFGGYLIPKGWQVFWNASVTHMDESIFKEPEKFDPSRFEKQSEIPPYCFIAFGAGPRICPGYEFAKAETLVAVHYMVTRFKWSLCCKDNTFVRDPNPSPKQGLPVSIEVKASL